MQKSSEINDQIFYVFKFQFRGCKFKALDSSIQVYIDFFNRKCWENIRLLNIKRVWTNQKKVVEWGLNENIQLPVTGELRMQFLFSSEIEITFQRLPSSLLAFLSLLCLILINQLLIFGQKGTGFLIYIKIVI